MGWVMKMLVARMKEKRDGEVEEGWVRWEERFSMASWTMRVMKVRWEFMSVTGWVDIA